MKIEINIEKKHLYFLAVFLAVIGIGVVIAAGSWTGGVPTSGVGHQDLYVDNIYPWSEGKGIKISSPSDSSAKESYARLDFDNMNGNDLFMIGYEKLKSNNMKRLLFSYYDGSNWKEAAYFDGDKNLWLNGKICDSNTGICYTLVELATGGNLSGAGGGVGGAAENVIFELNTNLEPKHGGKELNNDGNTAKQFCYESAGTEQYEILNTGEEGCSSKSLAIYSNNNWNANYNCQIGTGYIKKLECKNVEITMYSFEDGQGDAGLSLNPLDTINHPNVGSYGDGFYYIVADDDSANQFCIQKGGHLGAVGYTSKSSSGFNCENAANSEGKILVRYYDPPNLPGYFYNLGWYGVNCEESAGIIDTITCIG